MPTARAESEQASNGAPDSEQDLSGATPDSLVNYSGVAPRIPEGGKFGGDLPGAPDTVRWCTGQSGVPDQGTLRLSFAPFI